MCFQRTVSRTSGWLNRSPPTGLGGSRRSRDVLQMVGYHGRAIRSATVSSLVSCVGCLVSSGDELTTAEPSLTGAFSWPGGRLVSSVGFLHERAPLSHA